MPRSFKTVVDRHSNFIDLEQYQNLIRIVLRYLLTCACVRIHMQRLTQVNLLGKFICTTSCHITTTSLSFFYVCVYLHLSIDEFELLLTS